MVQLQKLRFFAGDVFRTIYEFFDDQWFDRTRNVRTSGEVTLPKAGVAAHDFADSEYYQPARPAHIRRALREMPVPDRSALSAYSFIDLGSGKGRTLFLAAELPFASITGVEFSPLLHAQACRNILSFRHPKFGSRNIASVHLNAMDFVFPETALVLYMFNPFGADTMHQVLANLYHSLKRNPRHAILLMLWPRHTGQLAAFPGMRLVRETREYQIFEVNPPPR